MVCIDINQRDFSTNEHLHINQIIFFNRIIVLNLYNFFIIFG